MKHIFRKPLFAIATGGTWFVYRFASQTFVSANCDLSHSNDYRLSTLERKLERDPTLKIEYTRVINEYKKLGHMSLIETPEDDGFYMPHHAVLKGSSNTTKV